ncbi:hypothetical protein ACA910_008279 [Epithemia clementina (nom. ined.)]
MDGVVGCVVGYSGGVQPDPTYDNIQDYTEAFLVEYNPDKLSYLDILEAWNSMDYPWAPQKTQYRSAVFTLSDKQQEQAKAFVQRLLEKRIKQQNKDTIIGTSKQSAGNSATRIYADVEPVTKFFKAEEYHQNFLSKQERSRLFTPF